MGRIMGRFSDLLFTIVRPSASRGSLQNNRLRSPPLTLAGTVAVTLAPHLSASPPADRPPAAASYFASPHPPSPSGPAPHTRPPLPAPCLTREPIATLPNWLWEASGPDVSSVLFAPDGKLVTLERDGNRIGVREIDLR